MLICTKEDVINYFTDYFKKMSCSLDDFYSYAEEKKLHKWTHVSRPGFSNLLAIYEDDPEKKGELTFHLEVSVSREIEHATYYKKLLNLNNEIGTPFKIFINHQGFVVIQYSNLLKYLSKEYVEYLIFLYVGIGDVVFNSINKKFKSLPLLDLNDKTAS